MRRNCLSLLKKRSTWSTSQARSASLSEMLIFQPQINDAPIKTEEIAATEFNDDITMSNVTLGRNGNDISRAHATMSSGKFASLPPSCKTGGLRHTSSDSASDLSRRYRILPCAIQPRRRSRATRAQQLYEARTPRSRTPQSATRLSPPWLIRVKRRLEGHGARGSR